MSASDAMAGSPKKVVIIAPYWLNPQHLGTIRIERFVRWLSVAGAEIVVVAGGSIPGCRIEPWGTLISIPDPLGIYREPDATATPGTPPRRPLLRWLAYALLSPDPGIIWAWRAAKHPLVIRHCAEADLVLSSSFPESAHVAAAHLAARSETRLVIDMRDGWLDEPMKPILATSRLRRLREGALERRILGQASNIFVTSEQWRSLLIERLPGLSAKTMVLTNAYPLGSSDPAVAAATVRPTDHRLQLLYAGRLYTSRAERRIDHLLAPLLLGLNQLATPGTLTFVGNLSAQEVEELVGWRPAYESAGWAIEVSGSALPRSEAIDLMRRADGLVLLSSSHASIPAKLFEYILARRPILAITPDDSAVASLAPDLGQLFALDHRKPDTEAVSRYIAACRNGMPCDQPEKFDERHLRTVFLTALDCQRAEPK